MSLKIGIVGLPNVGKSTLFNALTKKSVPAENYPFCTIDPSVGVVAVPDERLQKLSAFSRSAKTVPAVVEFVDIAGLVKGAAEGEGLGNQFLTHIREVDAIAEVVRIFEDDKIIHVAGVVDPLCDIGVINLELVLKDMETVSKRLVGIGKEVRAGKKEAVVEHGLLNKLQKIFEEGKLVSGVNVEEVEKPFLNQLQLLTAKPIIYVLNYKTGSKNLNQNNDSRWHTLIDFFNREKAPYILVDAGIESDLRDVLSAEEKTSLRKDFGVEDDGVNNLIAKGYDMLGLITFFTTGEDETRAWTIKKDSAAPEAGATIHSDFREKFIRAEIISWRELLDSGSYGKAREKGLVRTEGREYIVQDGDVIEFRI